MTAEDSNDMFYFEHLYAYVMSHGELYVDRTYRINFGDSFLAVGPEMRKGIVLLIGRRLDSEGYAKDISYINDYRGYLVALLPAEDVAMLDLQRELKS